MKRILFCLLAALSLCLATGCAMADVSGNYMYTVELGEATINQYMLIDPETDVTIPATLGGAPVTAIASKAFQGFSSLEHITMPDTVTTIGGMAFINCTSLESIHLSSALTGIPTSCFQNCSALSSVTLPATLTTIGRNAFSGCTALTAVVIPSNVYKIDAYAFSGCTALRSITLPESSIRIDASALPEGVRIICSAGSASAQSQDAFMDPNLPGWVLSWRGSVLGVLMIVDYEGASTRPAVPTAASGITIYGMEPDALLGHALDTLQLPQDLTTIGDDALLETAAAKVVIPASCTRIGAHAFAENPWLIYVYLPAGLTDIASTAFDGCPHAVLVTQTADSAIEAYAEANGLGYLDLSSLQ